MVKIFLSSQTIKIGKTCETRKSNEISQKSKKTLTSKISKTLYKEDKLYKLDK